MSKTHEETIACPNCEKESEATIYDSINTKVDPHLREELFEGGINIKFIFLVIFFSILFLTDYNYANPEKAQNLLDLFYNSERFGRKYDHKTDKYIDFSRLRITPLLNPFEASGLILSRRLKDKSPIIYPRVDKVKISKMINKEFNNIFYLKNMKCLTLGRVIFDYLKEENYKYIGKVEGLKKLRLVGKNLKIPSKFFMYIKQIKELESLEVNGVIIDDLILNEITNIEQLNKLEITGKFNSIDNLKNVSELGFENFDKLVNLRRIELECPNFSDESLKYIIKCSKLNSITIKFSNLTDKNLKSLNILKNLKYLNLSYSKIKGSGLKYLSNSNLFELVLFSPYLDTEGFREVIKLKQIKRLSFDKSNISDENLIYLNKMNLNFLYIKNGITDKSVEYLLELKNINKLWLSKAKISEYNKLLLKKKFKKVYIF